MACSSAIPSATGTTAPSARLRSPRQESARSAWRVLALDLAQGVDELLAVRRADAGHVVVTLEGDLAGVAEHVGILVIEGDQRWGAAEGLVAHHPAELAGGRGRRQDVVER